MYTSKVWGKYIEYAFNIKFLGARDPGEHQPEAYYVAYKFSIFV